VFSKRIRPLWAAVALVGSAVAVCACGSSGSSDSGTSTTAASTPATTATTAAPSSAVKLTWKDLSGDMTKPTANGDQYSVDLGGGQTVTWNKADKLKIAFFQQAQSNTYLQAVTKGIMEAAKASGATVTVFDSNFDPAMQRSQIQNAISSKKFNAAIVLPVASAPSCSQLTKDMPKGGMPVVVIEQQTCNRDAKSGPDMWSPGTVAYVGEDWNGYYQAFTDGAAKSISAPTDTILIGGPKGNAPSNSAQIAAGKTSKANPNMKLVGVARTDYTTPQALTNTQNLLQAHPKVGVVLLQYGGQIPGVVQALKQANKTAKVKVFDSGGSQIEKNLIQKGQLESTFALFPYTDGYCAADMLAAMWKGTAVPRVVVNECHPTETAPDQQTAVLLNKGNVADFKPEY
jgi:ribose transport system substrate-binding protein